MKVLPGNCILLSGDCIEGILPLSNGGTGTALTIGSPNQLWGVDAAGTAIEFKGITSTLAGVTIIPVLGSLSAPGAGANSEKFGAGAVTSTWTGTTVVGNSSSATFNNSTLIGYNNNGSGTMLGVGNSTVNIFGNGSIVVGQNADATFGGVTVGDSSLANFFGVTLGGSSLNGGLTSVVLGYGNNNFFVDCVIIGTSLSTSDNNQCIFGPNILNYYFGNGIASATPNDITTFRCTTGSGTDIAGTGLVIAPGQATGNNSSSTANYIAIKTGVVGTTGTTAQTLVERIRFKQAPNSGAGEMVINDSGDLYDLRIEGDTDANLFQTDSVNNRIGIGVAAPSEKLHVLGNVRLATYGLGVVHSSATGLLSSSAVDLTTEVSGILPIANGGTNLSAVGTANQIFGTNAGATALEYKAVTVTAAGVTVIHSGGSISSVGAGANSEKFGAGASTASTLRSTCVGNIATTNSSDATVVGYNARVQAGQAMAIGSNALASGLNSLSIGYNAVASQIAAFALGTSSTASNFACFALGTSTSATNFGSTQISGGSANTFEGSIALTGTCTANFQLVIGGANNPLTTSYIGSGVTSTATGASLNFTTTGGSGSNRFGTSLFLSAGLGTGNAATNSEVQIFTPLVAASSSTLQTTQERLRFKQQPAAGGGEAVFNEQAYNYDLRVEGTTNTNLLMVDASADAVGINQATPLAKLHITQSTLGNEVHRMESVATNDDPVESVFQNRLETTDATVTTIHTLTIPAGKAVTSKLVINGRRTAGGTADDAASFIRNTLHTDVAGTATLVGGTALPGSFRSAGLATSTVALTPTGGTVLIQITGVAGVTITWHMTLKTYTVGT